MKTLLASHPTCAVGRCLAALNTDNMAAPVSAAPTTCPEHRGGLGGCVWFWGGCGVSVFFFFFFWGGGVGAAETISSNFNR